MKMNVDCTASELIEVLKEMDCKFDKTVLDNVFITLIVHEKSPCCKPLGPPNADTKVAIQKRHNPVPPMKTACNGRRTV